MLRRHPGVAQVAVVGVPDRRMGEVGLAVVVPAAGGGPHDLQEDSSAVGQGAAGQLQGPPAGGDGGALPVNASAKVLKRELREQQSDAEPPPAPVPTDAVTERQQSNSTNRGRGRGAMRGIVFTGDDVEVTDQLSVGDPGPTEVRVAIGAAGVCHSDLSVINGTIPWKAPSVLGHEGAGVVEAVGSEVRSVKVGDHVVIATLQLRHLPGLQHRPSDLVREDPRQRGPALHLQGRAGIELRRHLGVHRVDHREGGPGGQDLEGRAHDLGLPHRLRGPDRRGLGAQPGQGPAR